MQSMTSYKPTYRYQSAQTSLNPVSGNFQVADDRLKTSFFALVLAKRPGRVDKQDSRGGDRTCNRCDCKQEACRTREGDRVNR